MKNQNGKFLAVYTTEEDCNCSCSHDTVVINRWDTREEAMADCQSFNGEPHKHSVIQSMLLQVMNDAGDVIEDNSIIGCTWDNKREEWGEVERYTIN